VLYTASSVIKLFNYNFKNIIYFKNNDKVLDDNFWGRLDLIINCSDKKDAKRYLKTKSIWYEKPLFDQMVHGLKGKTQVVIPHQTSDLDTTELNTIGLLNIDQEQVTSFPYLVNVKF
jgi:molybdopterin/thiamine biosynthesis adenylyltransferase